MSDLPFTHLHCHDEGSELDGLGHPSEMAATAAADPNQLHLAVTNHGTLSSIINHDAACRNLSAEQLEARGGQPLHPILGIEAYMAIGSRHDQNVIYLVDTDDNDPDLTSDSPKGRKRKANYHLTLFARNQAGFQSLARISTASYLEGFYGKPRADKDLLAENADGLLLTTGCLGGEVATLISRGQFDAAVKLVNFYIDLLGRENVWVEVMDHGIPGQTRILADLFRLAKVCGVGAVVTQDAHYPHKHQGDPGGAHDAWLCAQTGASLSDPSRFKFSGDFHHHLATAQEMYGRHPNEDEWVQACRNTVTVGEACTNEQSIIPVATGLPAPPVPDEWRDRSYEYLIERARAGCIERYGEITDEINERLEYELPVIRATGYHDYFHIFADLCDKSRARGIRIGPGRGSAAGCLVSYALGITDIDPIRYGLLFERFLNPDRVAPPDIDVDFAASRREEVIDILAETYGADHVAVLGTYGKMLTRAAIESASRMLDFTTKHAADLKRGLPPLQFGKDVPFDRVFGDGEWETAGPFPGTEQFRTTVDQNEWAAAIIKLARSLEGRQRTTGIHASGVLVSADPLSERIPLRQEHTSSSRPPVNGELAKATLNPDNLVPLNCLGFNGTKATSPPTPIGDPDQLRKEIAATLTEHPTITVVLTSDDWRQGDSAVHEVMVSSVVDLGAVDFESIVADDPTVGAFFFPSWRTNDKLKVTTVTARTRPTTQWTGEECEDLGYIKLDVLASKNQDFIAATIKRIVAKHGAIPIDIDGDIEDVDAWGMAETYALLGRGDTFGVFQVESALMRGLLAAIKPQSPEQVSDVIAIGRPGPMGEGLHLSYISRLRGDEAVGYYQWTQSDGTAASLNLTLEETYGVIVYQEQVMRIAASLAGFSRGETDSLRKAMGKKIASVLDPLREKFVGGFVENGHAAADAESIWLSIEKFADYAFNKSHSVSYGKVTLQTAWLRAMFPLETAASLLSAAADAERVTLILDDCRARGIELTPPNIARPLDHVEIDYDNNSLSLPISAIRGLGDNAVESLISEFETNGPFESMADLVLRVPNLNVGHLENLIRSGACDVFGDRLGLLQGVGLLKMTASEWSKKQAAGEVARVGSKGSLDPRELPVLEARSTALERGIWEVATLGVALSCNLMDYIQEPLAAKFAEVTRGKPQFPPRVPISRLAEFDPGSDVVTGGVVGAVTCKKIANGPNTGKLWAIIELAGTAGSAELRVFSKTLESVARSANVELTAEWVSSWVGGGLLVRGRISEDEGGVSADSEADDEMKDSRVSLIGWDAWPVWPEDRSVEDSDVRFDTSAPVPARSSTPEGQLRLAEWAATDVPETKEVEMTDIDVGGPEVSATTNWDSSVGDDQVWEFTTEVASPMAWALPPEWEPRVVEPSPFLSVTEMFKHLDGELPVRGGDDPVEYETFDPGPYREVDHDPPPPPPAWMWLHPDFGAEPVDEPAVVEPVDEPVVVEPVDEPAAMEPVVVEPVDEPAVVEPVDEPVVVEPVDEPAAMEPAVVEPVDEPAAVEPAVVEPVDEPAAVEPVDEPAAMEPVDEPAAMEPVDEPAVVEPVDEPAVVEPVDEPVSLAMRGVNSFLTEAGGRKLPWAKAVERDAELLIAKPVSDVTSTYFGYPPEVAKMLTHPGLAIPTNTKQGCFVVALNTLDGGAAVVVSILDRDPATITGIITAAVAMLGNPRLNEATYVAFDKKWLTDRGFTVADGRISITDSD